jgi:hypothetical protein
MAQDPFVQEIIDYHSSAPYAPEKVLEYLRILWEKYPKLRLGQLLLLITKSGKKLFEVENKELLEIIQQKVQEGI